MTFRRVLAGLVGLPLALFIVLFAVANRQEVVVGFDPFNPDQPAVSFTLPLFAVMLAMLMAGVLIGGVAAWLKQGRWRKEAKRRRVENSRLEGEKEAARRDAASARAALPAPSRHAA